MKNFKHLLFVTISLLSLSTYAQTSKKTLNYQAVILDPNAIDIPGASISGLPLNKGKVCLRFSLLNSQGGLDYEETQQVTTDEFGLVSVSIGTGTQGQAINNTSVYKSFESIMWNASVKSLKVSVSYDGCSSFKQVSTQSFNYTPYALYAEAVEYKNVREAPTKLSQFSNDAGYLIPKDLDPLKTEIKSNSSQIATANQTIQENKQASDASFLVTNQSITSLDEKVADNMSSITKINTKITDQQNQISDNRNQISSTNNNLNNQIGGLQSQINNTNYTVSNLTGVAELQSNKSTNVQTDATSDTKYPTVKALKFYVDQATLGIALATDLQGIASDLQRLGNEKANIASPSFTGTPILPTGTIGVTQSATDNSTKLATTAFVQTATSGIALQAAVDAKADKNSPTFTGTPNLPTGTNGITQSVGDNSTKLATTAFVASAVQNYLPKLTTIERDLISGLVEGLIIWNKTNKQLEVYDGTYWVTTNGKLVSNLNVGDSYGGGIVAYIFLPGDYGYVAGQTHGLIAAIVDQTTEAGVKWFPSIFYDVTRTILGQGLSNTISIIAASGGSSLTSYAAGLASNYKGGGYSDWYLPSKDELNKLYQNRAAIGNFATSGIAAYWSSSQKGTFNFKDFTEYAKGISSAWVQLFFESGGELAGTIKDLGISNLRRVRAVRVF